MSGERAGENPLLEWGGDKMVSGAFSEAATTNLQLEGR